MGNCDNNIVPITIKEKELDLTLANLCTKGKPRKVVENKRVLGEDRKND